MNYKVLALIIMGIVFLFETVIGYLKMKSSEREIPENVADVYDKAEYERWLSYNKEVSRFSFIRHLVSYAISFSLISFNVYAGIVNATGVKNLYTAAVVIVIADSMISTIWTTPFSYVRNMKIEEKYGFNRMTKKVFFVDLIKEFIIGIALSCGLICGLTAIHQAMGHWMLIVFTAIMMVIVVGVVFLQPVITRVFNKLTPLEEGELRSRLIELLEKNDCSVRQISVSDGSTRSTKANAYFGGFGKMKTIVLYDTLIEQMTEDEIVAVFAHEMGHNKHKDTLRLMVLNVLNVFLTVFCLWALVSFPEIYTYFGFEGINYGFAFVLAGTVCLAFISPFIGLLVSTFSRKYEYAADKFAADNGYGEALISGLKKLARNSFDNLSPHPIVVALTYSHPTISQRVEYLEKCMKK